MRSWIFLHVLSVRRVGARQAILHDLLCLCARLGAPRPEVVIQTKKRARTIQTTTNLSPESRREGQRVAFKINPNLLHHPT